MIGLAVGFAIGQLIVAVIGLGSPAYFALNAGAILGVLLVAATRDDR